MNVLGLFHALSPETVQKMDSDLKEAKLACQRQHGLVSELRNDLKVAEGQWNESVVAGANLRELLNGTEAELESLRTLLAAENAFHVRRQATLRGQITKLKKRLSDAQA